MDIINMRDYPTLYLDTNYSKWTTGSKKGCTCVYANEQERLSNITLSHILK
jgi:hypothetical protein